MSRNGDTQPVPEPRAVGGATGLHFDRVDVKADRCHRIVVMTALGGEPVRPCALSNATTTSATPCDAAPSNRTTA